MIASSLWMSSRMSNWTRSSLIVIFPNTDPLKYHIEFFFRMFKKSGDEFCIWSGHVIHQFQSISSLFDLGPFPHYSGLYAFCQVWLKLTKWFLRRWKWEKFSDGQTDRQTDRQTDNPIDSQTEGQSYRETQTNKPTDRQTDRPADGQPTDSQIEGQSYIWIYIDTDG